MCLCVSRFRIFKIGNVDQSDHEESPDPLDELTDLKLSPVTLEQALTDHNRDEGNINKLDANSNCPLY